MLLLSVENCRAANTLLTCFKLRVVQTKNLDMRS